MSDFKFAMIGAMYENGGNTTQRFLDGHPELAVYPFESQPGTRLVQDQYSSMFPLKYRWPVFPLSGKPETDYEMIIDEECKVRIKTPFVSKFRDTPMELNDKERKEIFLDLMKQQQRSTASIMECFFRATFDAWKDFNTSGNNRIYVGYSPIITVDAERILADLPNAHMIHVVRNPFSAYADTKKRPLPMSLKAYITAWCTNQYHALVYKSMYPQNCHIVRLEDLINDSKSALQEICDALAINNDEESLTYPSWNSQKLSEVYPWGTIRIPTPDANKATADELSNEEKKEISSRASIYIEKLNYSDFLG